jgi:hypothetical protein
MRYHFAASFTWSADGLLRIRSVARRAWIARLLLGLLRTRIVAGRAWIARLLLGLLRTRIVAGLRCVPCG